MANAVTGALEYGYEGLPMDGGSVTSNVALESNGLKYGYEGLPISRAFGAGGGGGGAGQPIEMRRRGVPWTRFGGHTFGRGW